MFAVAGGKGGCGKTTTTLGVGRAAARAGAAALLVDADAGMANLHRAAGVDRDPTLADGPPATVAQHLPDAPSVGIVAAPLGEAVETAALTRCRSEREVVLVDCPAGAGPDAAVPLRVADATVLVTTLEPACLRDAARTAAMSRAVDTPVAGVVVSRADRAPAGLADLLEATVLGCVPPFAGRSGNSAERAAHDRIYRSLPGRRV